MVNHGSPRLTSTKYLYLGTRPIIKSQGDISEVPVSLRVDIPPGYFEDRHAQFTMRLLRSSLQCPLRPLQSKPYLIGISIKYLLGLDRRHYSDSTDDNDRVRRVWWEKGGLEEFSYERKRRERTPSQKRPNLFPVKGQHQLVKNSNPYLSISDEIFTAVLSGKPVVALESTIYTHGFPFPDNILLALDLERVVRSYGAIPATIGIIDGVARIGLTSEEIKILASGAGNPETMKVSRRDIPYILGMVSLFYQYMYHDLLYCRGSWVRN